MRACLVTQIQVSKMSFSLETRQTSRYSDDWRWRMVWQKEALLMLIFLDETGSDRRNSIRRDGYSVRGRVLV
jgi:hypothetical protein